MKRLFLLPLFTLPCFAAITNIQASGATPREVILRYLAPTPAACTIEVSEFAGYSPLVNDVNTALFNGSNSDFRITRPVSRGWFRRFHNESELGLHAVQRRCRATSIAATTSPQIAMKSQMGAAAPAY